MKRALTARPTAPSPKIATDDPFFGFATFTVAPKPEKEEKVPSSSELHSNSQNSLMEKKETEEPCFKQ